VHTKEHFKIKQNHQNRALLRSKSEEKMGKMKEQLQKAMEIDRRQVTRKSLITQYYNVFLTVIMQSKVQKAFEIKMK